MKKGKITVHGNVEYLGSDISGGKIEIFGDLGTNKFPADIVAYKNGFIHVHGNMYLTEIINNDGGTIKVDGKIFLG